MCDEPSVSSNTASNEASSSMDNCDFNIRDSDFMDSDDSESDDIVKAIDSFYQQEKMSDEEMSEKQFPSHLLEADAYQDYDVGIDSNKENVEENSSNQQEVAVKRSTIADSSLPSCSVEPSNLEPAPSNLEPAPNISEPECEYSREAHFMHANNSLGGTEEDNRTLRIPRNYSKEINFIVNDSLPMNDFQHGFTLEAEKLIKNLDLISRKEKELLMNIKNNLPQEANYAVHRVKTSMKNMHEKYTKQFDVELNALASVLTRIEHLHEEMQDFKQWKQTDEESLAKIDSFLRESIHEKEIIEAMVKKTVGDLNIKRQNDARLFSEFEKSINLKVQQSLKGLSECIHNAEIRRKARVDAKVTELVLDLK